MAEQGRPLQFGYFPVPYASEHTELLRQVQLAEQVGYDLVGVQDHPYQRRFLDTFVLLPWLAAATERIRFFPDVTHLPLRPPAMLAKAVASLDVLSGGRVELGIGAGGFPQASQAMGAPQRTPGASLTALEEAIDLLRRFWDTPERGIHHEGPHYRLGGVKAGPAPTHDIGIWVGGGGPRMLRLVGRLADGWIPPAVGSYLTVDELVAKQRKLSQAAADVGRDPAAIRRILNLAGSVTDGRTEEPFTGPVEHWVDQLAGLAVEGFDTFVFWPDASTDEQLRAFAEVADRLRRDVGAARRA